MRVALALGSGGARGYAHIGALRELDARGHEVVALSGASMGAVVGGIHAAGQLDRFETWVRTLTQRDVLRLLDVSFVGGGAIKAGKIMAVISELLDGARIEELAIPYTAVATDLRARREVWFTRGPLDVAVRASFAIPSVITPAVVGGRLMVDGGVTNPVPLEPLAMTDADMVLAVSLTGRRAGVRESTTRESSDPDESGADAAGSRGRLRGRTAGRRATPAVAELGGRIRSAAVDVRGTEVFRTLAAKLGQNVDEWGTAVTPEGSEEVSEAVEDGAGADSYGSLPATLGLFDVVIQSLDAMEALITSYRMAGIHPDVLVEVPSDVCSALDFHRADEVIELGRRLTAQALDAAGY